MKHKKKLDSSSLLSSSDFEKQKPDTLKKLAQTLKSMQGRKKQNKKRKDY